VKYLSVCSGIEAATVAWHPLGWEAAAFSEIESFPSAVLAHHYPNVPNLGDMTKFKEWNFGTNIDVFVGGTPCQSFSVAGLRKGLDDPRGNLMLTYLAIADKFRPKWLVWENVPGVLSSDNGKDFATFLGGLGELGYGFAYRVLDAQYFGVAQRRRRVFVVGYLGDWRPAAAVLFERDSLQRNPPPSRKKRERTSAFFESSLAQYRAADVGGTLKASGGVLGGGSETFLAQRVGSGDQGGMTSAYSIREDAQANTFSATELEVATALKALQPSVQSHHAQTFVALSPPTIVHGTQDPCVSDIAFAQGTNNGGENVLIQSMAVRRLTPIECERLQGFPDGYTNIPWNKKPESPDGPRYKALGNSMAVPVMAWIGKRINQYEQQINSSSS